MTHEPASTVLARFGTAAYVALGLALVGIVASLPALWLVDLSAWVYQGALWNAEVADASSTPWSPVRHPVPNTLATLIPTLLLSVAGPVWVGKAIAIGLLVSGFGTAWSLARAAPDASSTWARAAVLVACVVVSSSFWNGYLGYQIGVVGALGLGAAWLRRGRLAPGAVALGTVGLFFAHAIPFGAVALALGLDALRRRDGRTLLALAPSGLLTIGYLAARASLPGGGFLDAEVSGGPVRWLAYKAYTVLKVGPFQHPDGLDGAGLLVDLPVVYWIAVGLSGVFVATLVIGLVHATTRMPAGGRRLAAWGAWALALLGLAMPPFALNVVNPGERVAVLAVAALVALVPLDGRLLRALGLAALAFLVDDAAALWAQRSGLPPETVAAHYADRAAREQGEPPAVVPLADRPLDALPLLGHPVLLHSDLYEAARRRDWTRRSFDSGILTPPASP